jgi:hypothetical protein
VAAPAADRDRHRKLFGRRAGDRQDDRMSGEDLPGADDGATAPTLPYAQRLAQELDRVATVRIDRVEAGVLVTVTPAAPDACPFGWRDFSDLVVTRIGAHDYSGRWSLAAEGAPEDAVLWADFVYERRSALDVGVLDDIVASVVAGRVREVHGWGRSEVTITLADGSCETRTDAAPALVLPLRLWRRCARSVRYAPYR